MHHSIIRSYLQIGFTLLEMAMLLIIVSLVLGGLLPTLSVQSESRSRQQAMEELKQIREALIGYAIVHQRLPCPAIGNSGGAEMPDGGGTCSKSVGFLPARTLGLHNTENRGGVFNPWTDTVNAAASLMLDPWGQPYIYAVDQTDKCLPSGTPDATTKGKLSAKFDCLVPKLTIKQCLNCVSAPSEEDLTTTAIAIVFSQGKTTVSNATRTRYPLEWRNLNRSTVAESTEFMTSDYNDQNSTSRFDDLMIWITPEILQLRLINAYVHGKS